MSKCTYKFQDNIPCNRDALPDRSLCILHEDFEHKDPEETNSAFNAEVDKGTTDFSGFKLPSVNIREKKCSALLFKDAHIQGSIIIVDCSINGELLVHNSIFHYLSLDNINIGNVRLINSPKSTGGQLPVVTFGGNITIQENLSLAYVDLFFVQQRDDSTISLQNFWVDNSDIGRIEMRDALVMGSVSIWDSKIKAIDFSRTEFKNRFLLNIIDLSECCFENAKFYNSLNIYGLNSKKCDFANAHFYDKKDKFTIELEHKNFDSFLSFEKARFDNSKTQEIASAAAKLVLEKNGYHELADIHHLMEMRAKYKQNSWTKKPLEKLFDLLMDSMCEYGINWKRILKIWLGIIVSYAIFYYCTAGVVQTIEKEVLKIDSCLDALYFSIVTATTLGYGDLQPVGWGRLIAASEAMLGMLFWTLLLVVIARKYMRS